jgi:hypothetical protein
MAAITKYDCGWNPVTKTGLVRIWVAGNSIPVVYPNLPPQDFCVFAALLQRSPLYIEQSGVIHSGLEDPGLV